MGTTRTDVGPAEAAAAIAGVETSTDWVAGRVIAPRWYHPALGLAAGALIAVAETRNWPLFYVAVAAYSAATGALLWANQRRAGVWIQAYRGRSGLVFAAQIVALAVLVGLACWLELVRGVHGAFLVAGVIAVPLLVLFGLWSDVTLRARLGSAR
jgi:hypothetical protein